MNDEFDHHRLDDDGAPPPCEPFEWGTDWTLDDGDPQPLINRAGAALEMAAL